MEDTTSFRKNSLFDFFFQHAIRPCSGPLGYSKGWVVGNPSGIRQSIDFKLGAGSRKVKWSLTMPRCVPVASLRVSARVPPLSHHVSACIGSSDSPDCLRCCLLPCRSGNRDSTGHASSVSSGMTSPVCRDDVIGLIMTSPTTCVTRHPQS